MSVKTVDEIKANVRTEWDHPNCKFYPGDIVIAGYGESQKARDRLGYPGQIVAVSAAQDGRIRGKTSRGTYRQFTRYYVQFFSDGAIHGYPSDYLHSHRDAI